MSYKIWIAIGILLLLAGISGTFLGIYQSFDTLQTEPAPEIGAVARGIKLALFCNVLIAVGIIPLVIGLVKFFRKK